MKKKIVSIAMALMVTTLSLAGCSSGDPNDINSLSKKELIARYQGLETNYNELAANYSSLDNMYKALSTEDQPSAAISTVGDGTTGQLTFNSVDSKIIFPSSFGYPEAKTKQADGKIDIVSNVSIAPGSNWVTQFNGTTLNLEHSSGISATVKVASFDQATLSAEQLQSDVLEQWFINVPKGNITYTKIFVNNSEFGVQAVTPTMISSENAVLRCGMLGYQNYAVTYIIVYRGEQDMTKEESIVSLLNTIKIMNNPINIEQ